MYRSVEFKLDPTVKQSVALSDLLFSQQQLYNAALESKIGRYKWNGASSSLFDGFKELTDAKAEIPSIETYGVNVHRGTLRRLNLAYQAFFRRIKNGETPGFPRFKSRNRWNSVEYYGDQAWKLYPIGAGQTGRLYVKGVGHVKLRMRYSKTRFKDCVPSNLVVKRKGNQWWARVVYKNVTPKEYPKSKTDMVGVDRGVNVVAALYDSDGDTSLFENDRILNQHEDALAVEQRKLSYKKKGSNRRRKQVSNVQRVYRRIAGARKYRAHLISKQLVSDYDTVVFEKLDIPKMSSSGYSGLNKAILDVGWGMIHEYCVYKAEEADKQVVFINPAYTSQTCPKCGHVDKQNRDGTVFKCVSCNHEGHADVVAAQNILTRGQDHAPASQGANLLVKGEFG